VWTRGAFATPLGEVPIAEALADALLARCDLAAADKVAHAGEHAIEVELPFLQVLRADASLLPVVLAWDDWRHAEQLGTDLAALVCDWPQPVLLLASSDMTHYESAARARSRTKGLWRQLAGSTDAGSSTHAGVSGSPCAGGHRRPSSWRRAGSSGLPLERWWTTGIAGTSPATIRAWWRTLGS
jgi:AmmeMemoRadiSam system protein B